MSMNKKQEKGEENERLRHFLKISTKKIKR